MGMHEVMSSHSGHAIFLCFAHYALLKFGNNYSDFSFVRQPQPGIFFELSDPNCSRERVRRGDF